MKKNDTYILKMDGLDLFVSNKQPLSGCKLTKSKKNAMEFSKQFDCPETKASFYSSIIQVMTNNNDIKFEAAYL